MRSSQYARVLERNAEIENVGMRVQRIVGRIDDFRAFQGHVLSDLYVDAARSKPRQMKQSVRLDDVELFAAADRVIEFAQKVRIARVRTVHRLELEAEIISGCFLIERTLDCQRRLIQECGIGFISKQLAKIRDGGIIRIARSTHFY